MTRLYVLTALLCGTLLAPPEPKDGVLAAGTEFETPWVRIDGAKPGPIVVVIGGVHGDECAGYVAAEAISHWSIERGRLVVVPRANPPAIAAGTRLIPGAEKDASNLNRLFPTDAPPAEDYPAELWKLLEKQEPDWLFDLHEGYDIQRVNEDSVGRSIIACDDDEARALAEKLLALADSTVEDPERAFTLLKNPIAGSIARAVWEQLGTRSMIVETTKKGGTVPARARRHRLVVHAALTALEMGPCDSNTLVDVERSGRRPRIALYDGPGANAGSVRRMRNALLSNAGTFVLRHVDVEDVLAGRLAAFDLVVHSGGSGSGQGKALGLEGRRIEREFVEGGGAFLGVCAGAYLAAANYDWSLAVVDAMVIDREHWNRGTGDVLIEATSLGRQCLGAPRKDFELRYVNGPIYAPAERDDIPDYTTLLTFLGEVAENGAPAGVMPGTPAAIAGELGAGRVMAISPHPERTEGRGELLCRGVEWLVAGRRRR